MSVRAVGELDFGCGLAANIELRGLPEGVQQDGQEYILHKLDFIKKRKFDKMLLLPTGSILICKVLMVK